MTVVTRSAPNSAKVPFTVDITLTKRNLHYRVSEVVFWKHNCSLIREPREFEAMLRITVEDGSRPSIRLEGKLSGPWVAELEKAWNRFAANESGKPITVDLSEVTFIDSAGKKLLSALVERGAELRAAHLMTKYIVGQIIEGCRGSAKVGG